NSSTCLGFRDAHGVEDRLTVEIVGVVQMNRATIKTLVIIIIHKIRQVVHNNIFAVITVGVLMRIYNYSIDHQEDLNQQRMNDVHNKFDDLIKSKNELIKTLQSLGEMLRQQEQATILSNHTFEPSRRFICYDDNDYEESTIPLNEIVSQIDPDVNPLFDEVLEDIESKVSYDSNLNEPTLLVTHFLNTNEDECFDPRGDIDEIDAFLEIDRSTDIKNGYHDSERDILHLESLVSDDITPNPPPEVF
nr:hypothetical protein [Tanacetum cinerariifolium]